MKRYKVKIDPSQVYDGDTIERVIITLIPQDESSTIGLNLVKDKPEEIWPGITRTTEGLNLEFNLRIDGIDAPEMEPHHHDANGVQRTVESLNTEKKMARQAKQALLDLISKGNNEIYVSSPKEGKYARRMVCTCEVYIDQNYINVGDYLIEKKLARPYEGGTKSKWA